MGQKPSPLKTFSDFDPLDSNDLRILKGEKDLLRLK